VKAFYWLVVFPWLLIASEHQNRVDIRLIGGGILSTKIVYQALNTVGQRVGMLRYENDGESVEMEMVVSGTKPFDPKYFTDILRENGVILTKGTIRNKRWNMEFNAAVIQWNIPAITLNEGAQMEKSLTANWFVVNQSRVISIDAPYSGKWYPEVAVLDSSLHVLSSIREFASRERLSFSLPEDAMYLKVSNTNGMKLLKEGVWIEASDSEQ
jgi:hypothetical protein